MPKYMDVLTGKVEDDFLEGIEPLPDAPKDAEVELTEELEQAYESARYDWLMQAKEDEAFRRGEQWTTEQKRVLKKRDQAPIVVNVINPAVETAKAMLTTNIPRFSSTAREDSDVSVGKMFSDIMSYIWDISDGNSKLKLSIDDYYVKSVGWLMAYVDPWADNGKGEIMIDSIDPYDILVDPNAKDLYSRDAAHILLRKELTYEQLISSMPNSTQFLKNLSESELYNVQTDREGSEGQSVVVRDTYHKRYKVIERYSKIKHILIRVIDKQKGIEKILEPEEFQKLQEQVALRVYNADGSVQYYYLEQELAFWLQLYEVGQGLFYLSMNPQDGQVVPVPGMYSPEDPYGIPDSDGKIELITMAVLFDTPDFIIDREITNRIKRVTTIADKLYQITELPVSDYPLVPIYNHFNRTPFALSDVRFVRPLQQEVNKLESLIVAHAANSTNVKVLIPSGSVDVKRLREEFSKAGAGVIEFNAEFGTPVIVSPVALPGELYRNKAEKVAEIERILGIYALQQGDNQNAPDTYKGTIALDEFGQRRIRSKKDDIEGALTVLAKVVVQLIQKVYTEEKTIRLIRPNNKPLELTINQQTTDKETGLAKKINDVTVGKYDIIVVSGSMLPSNRWALVEYYKELYKDGLLDQQTVLEKTEVADVEEVLSRIGQMQNMQMQLAQSADQIKKLEGDMQTADREIIHLRRQVEIEKFKKDLGGIESSMKATAEVNRSMMQKDMNLFGERMNYEKKIQVEKLKNNKPGKQK